MNAEKNYSSGTLQTPYTGAWETTVTTLTHTDRLQQSLQTFRDCLEIALNLTVHKFFFSFDDVSHLQHDH